MEKIVKVSMEITINAKDFPALKRITHHIEEFVNLADWREIKRIEAVKIDEVW